MTVGERLQIGTAVHDIGYRIYCMLAEGYEYRPYSPNGLYTCFIFSQPSDEGYGIDVYVTAAIALFCITLTLLVFICLKDLKSNLIYVQINSLLTWIVALALFVAAGSVPSNVVSQ